MKHPIAIIALSLAAAASFGQARSFGPWTVNGFNFYQKDGGNTQGSSDLHIRTSLDVLPYVYIGGDLDASLDVSGMGSGVSSIQPAQFQILTNLPLLFQFTSFGRVADVTPGMTPLSLPSDSIMVHYYFLFFQNWTTGRMIDPSGQVTGAYLGRHECVATNSRPGVNGSFSLPLDLTTNGVAGFRVDREVSISGYVPGNRTYRSTGQITVSVN